MTTDELLIDMCERLGLALDINYLRGTVTVGRKRFAKMDEAFAYVQSRANALKNFG